MSVAAFWTTLLIIHGLLALALLGAITHQAVAVVVPARKAAGGFVVRFRAVPATVYATAIVVLYVLTFIMGAWIYAKYRTAVRIPLEQLGYWKTHGSFELKEHVAAIGLALLPAYWYFWRQPLAAEYAGTRKWLTVLLAATVWYCFLVGHIVNNVRGFGI